MRAICKPTMALLLAPLVLGGCKMIGAILIMTAPPQIAKPEYELDEGRLAIVIDMARAAQSNPVFDLALHERIVTQFRDNKVPTRVIPFEDVVQLKQSQPEYRNWSVQRIGRDLDADRVLYLRIDQLRARSDPGDPIIQLSVELRAKLIGVSEPPMHARLWPNRDKEMDGRIITHSRPPKEADSLDIIDAETVKLGHETAYYVARCFHEYDEETNPPREP
ncbi:MAG: hypothetical protein ABIG44_07750 [Planctomycetota bacterium]